MDYSKVLEEQERLLIEGGLMVGKSESDADCCFLLKTGPRHCKACTNTSCKGCKFFSPTIHAKTRLVVEAALKKEQVIADLDYEKRMIKDAKQAVEREYWKEKEKSKKLEPFAQVGKSCIRHHRKQLERMKGQL